MADIHGKTAWLTGAAQGLGRAIANAFVDAGLNVVIFDIQADVLAQVASELQACGSSKIVPVVADLADATDTKRAANAALEALGTPRIVVHNAANLQNRPLLDITIEQWTRETNVIMQAAFLLTQAVWQPMTDAGGGNIVYVSSRSGITGFMDESTYVVGKHAIEGLMKCMAMEGEAREINVNTITPGMYMHTPSSERTYPDELKRQWVDPMLLTPAFVALASEATHRISGERLNAWAISEAVRAGEADPLATAVRG